MAKKIKLAALLSIVFTYEFSDGSESDFEYTQQSTKQTMELEKEQFSITKVVEMMKQNTKPIVSIGKKSVAELYDDIIEYHDIFEMKNRLNEEIANLSRTSTSG